MALTDKFVGRIDEALAVGDVWEMGELVKEIVAVFASADQHIKVGLDRYKNRATVPGQQIASITKAI